jgi:hypothetical protein
VAPTTLDFRAGELRVIHWPADLRPPFGLWPCGDGELRGPARLHAAAVRQLRAAARPFTDRVAPPTAGALPLAPAPPLPPDLEQVFLAWCAHGHRGTACGLDDAARHALVHAATAARRPALLVVPDTGAADLWLAALRARGLPPLAAAIATVAAAARDIGWLGRRHDLLVVDLPELMPGPRLLAVLDGSAAGARLLLPQDANARDLLAWTGRSGPVLAVVDRGPGPRSVELRVPLPADARAVYDAAWSEFLVVYDRFAVAHPHAGFAAFVALARGDPVARPGLLAWHRALRAAAGNAAKAAIVARLLARHGGELVLVFAPDRASTYAFAREHLIAPVTAEIPRAERRAAVAAFVRGELRALVGPRLLDTGVPERCADVGIAVGGGFGRAQRRARAARIRAGGLFYELCGLDTVEVGRARRWRGSAADAAVVVHRR